MAALSARFGDAIAPHGNWSGGTISSASPNVNVEGMAAARKGDSGTPHLWIGPSPTVPPHSVTISSGSSTVFINGMPAARFGDPTDCGSSISSSAATVFIGG